MPSAKNSSKNIGKKYSTLDSCLSNQKTVLRKNPQSPVTTKNGCKHISHTRGSVMLQSSKPTVPWQQLNDHFWKGIPMDLPAKNDTPKEGPAFRKAKVKQTK